LLLIVTVPFIGTETLIAKILPFLSTIPLLPSQPLQVDLTTLVVCAGFLAMLIGALLGAVLFGLGRFGRAHASLMLFVLGLLMISASLFSYSGNIISEMLVVSWNGIWPELGVFGIGYLISWVAVIVGLITSSGVQDQARAQVSRYVQPLPISQPSMVEHLVPTGYVALDAVLNGGVPVGSSLVLTSPRCDEEDILIHRVLETTLRNNHPCILISSTLDRVRDLLPKYRRLLFLIICNPQADMLTIGIPEAAKLKTLDSLTELNLDITNAIGKMNPSYGALLCFETLDDILLTHHGATRRWLIDILTRVKSNHVTCVATLNPAMHPQTESQGVLEAFDGQIDLYEAEIQVRPKLIRVRRLGGRKFIDTELRVDKDKI
jgi:KaiC/GvpD/RAD55 family RecA-like ATPase